MKAVFVLGNKHVKVREVPKPEAKDDLVVVKIMASVLCGTEHTAYEAPPTRAGITGGSGHEAAGLLWETDNAPLGFWECEDLQEQKEKIIENMRALLQLFDIEVLVYPERIEIKGTIPTQVLERITKEKPVTAPIISSPSLW